MDKIPSAEILQGLITRLYDWKTSYDRLADLESAEDEDEGCGLGSLLVAYQYCHVLIHRAALRSSMRQQTFGVCHERALLFGRQMLEDLKHIKSANFDSFWFSCKDPEGKLKYDQTSNHPRVSRSFQRNHRPCSITSHQCTYRHCPHACKGTDHKIPPLVVDAKSVIQAR